MNTELFEEAVLDPTISDDEYFQMLLKYFSEQEFADHKRGITGMSIDSLEYKAFEAEMEDIRNMLAEKRPAVVELLRAHVIKQHEYCCGPKAKNQLMGCK